MTNLSCRIGATLGVLLALVFAGCGGGGGGPKARDGGSDAGMDIHGTGDVSPDRIDATADVKADVASTDGTDTRSDVAGDRGAGDADGAPRNGGRRGSLRYRSRWLRSIGHLHQRLGHGDVWRLPLRVHGDGQHGLHGH